MQMEECQKLYRFSLNLAQGLVHKVSCSETFFDQTMALKVPQILP